jgi:hypothetical protein
MRSADQKRELANPMLFRMAGSAQRNGIAIARFHPYTTIRFRSAHARPLMALRVLDAVASPEPEAPADRQRRHTNAPSVAISDRSDRMRSGDP